MSAPKHLDTGVTDTGTLAAFQAAKHAVADGTPAAVGDIVDTTGTDRWLPWRKWAYRALTGLIPLGVAAGWVTGETAALIGPAVAGFLGVGLAAANTK